MRYANKEKTNGTGINTNSASDGENEKKLLSNMQELPQHS